MKLLRSLLFALAFAAALLSQPQPLNAQAVQQSGSISPGQPARWITNGVIGAGGSATAGQLTTLGVTASGPAICQTSASSGARNRVCMTATATGGGFTLDNIGGGTGGFTLSLNGVTQGLATVTLPVTATHAACFADSTGTLNDCGGSGVVGPGSTTVGNVAVWNDTTGNTLANAGGTANINLSTANGALITGVTLNFFPNGSNTTGFASAANILRPNANGTMALGDPSFLWSNIYTTSVSISNSLLVGTTSTTSVRDRITAARDYYVRTDGSDSNTGLTNTAGGAFLTIQRCLNVVQFNIDTAGNNVQCRVQGMGSSATYTGSLLVGQWEGYAANGFDQFTVLCENGTVTISANTSAYTIFSTQSGPPVKWSGCTLQNSAASGIVINADDGAFIVLHNVTFNATGAGGIHIVAQIDSRVMLMNSTITVAGNAGKFAQITGNAKLINQSGTILALGSGRVFSTALAHAASGGQWQNTGLTVTGSLGSSSVPYIIDYNTFSGIDDVSILAAISGAGAASATPISAGIGGTGTITNTANAILKGNGGSAIISSGVSIDSSNNISGAGTIASGAITVTSTSANALAVGRQGTTNPVLKIDASTSSVVTGIGVTGAASGNRVAVAAISSATDEGVNFDAKGAGTIRLGATSTGAIEFSRNAVPTASDGAALGTGTLMWSDLFLASGAVVNFNNGNCTITHSAALLTVSCATLYNSSFTALGAGAFNGAVPIIGTYTDNGATTGPLLNLDRNSTSAAAADDIGGFTLSGRNSTPAQINYITMNARILDPTASSEDGALDWYTYIAGTNTPIGSLGPGLYLGSTFHPTPPGVGGLTADGNIILTNLATDATHTDRTVCQDTTSKQLFFGSGAAGICLGTSSQRFKRDIRDLADEGLAQILQLRPRLFHYLPGYGDDGAREQYGLIAEEVDLVLPKLVGRDSEGRITNLDYGALWPIMVRAIQELKADNDNLRNEIMTFKRAANR